MRMKQAGFRVMKSLENFDFSAMQNDASAKFKTTRPKLPDRCGLFVDRNVVFLMRGHIAA